MTALGRTTWPELDAARGTQGPLLLAVPLGSCEQHGPHLPFDVDTDVAGAVCAGLGDVAGAVVGPAVPYGASGEHEDFPGTVSIGTAALELLLVELGRSATRWAERVLLVNGHGGNAAALVAAVRRLRAEGRDVAWWPCGVAGGDAHAGRTESSLLLALRPADVRSGTAVAGRVEPVGALLGELRERGVRAVSPTGVLGDPAGASAQEGQRLLAELQARLRRDAAAWSVDAHGRLGS